MVLVCQLSSFFSRYRVSNEGDFLLRSPKRMTGTDGFLEQDSRRTGCQRESQDVCLGRKLAEEGFKKCACRPWGLLSALPNEVALNGDLLLNHLVSILEPQVLPSKWQRLLQGLSF